MDRNDGRHTVKKHALHQGRGHEDVAVRLSWWRHQTQVCSYPFIATIITVSTGCADVQIDISPTEARDLAANLLKHADEVESAQQQLERELDAVPA